MRLKHRTTSTKQSGLTSASDAMKTMVKELVDKELAAAVSNLSIEQTLHSDTNESSHNSSQINALQSSMNAVDVSMDSLTNEILTIKSNVAALEETTSSLSTSATATIQNVNSLTQSLSALDSTVAQHKAETDQNLQTEIAALPNWTGRLFNEMHPYCTTIWGNVGGSNIPSWIGSGSWINPVGLFDQSPRHGFLLTAAHVIDAASNITSIWILRPNSLVWTNHPLRRVTTNSGSQNVFEDTVTDIAVITLNEVISAI